MSSLKFVLFIYQLKSIEIDMQDFLTCLWKKKTLTPPEIRMHKIILFLCPWNLFFLFFVSLTLQWKKTLYFFCVHISFLLVIEQTMDFVRKIVCVFVCHPYIRTRKTESFSPRWVSFFRLDVYILCYFFLYSLFLSVYSLTVFEIMKKLTINGENT